MKILHITPTLDPAVGGLPMVVYRLAAAQAALGHEVHILTYASPHAQTQIEQAYAAVPHRQLVHCHLLAPSSRFEFLVGRRARAAVDQFIRERPATALHLHGVWCATSLAASKAARRLRHPYLLAPHSMLHRACLDNKWPKKQIAMYFGYRSMLTHAAAIHCLNEHECQAVLDLRLNVPSVILPNGLFLEEVSSSPLPGSFHAAYPQLQGCPFILFIGRLHHVKGLDYLADAFAILTQSNPQVQLVIVGPDAGEQAPFSRRVAHAGLTHRVHMLGPLYGSLKQAALADAACYCLPSRLEGFSVAIAEALGCGVPVVISHQCNFPEVPLAGAGEAVPLDAPQIAAALERVLSDPQRRLAMGQAGRQLVASRYLWPQIAEQSLAIYQRILTPD
ncbi:MAG: glycosyltransferase [Planctomycetota bacterium]|nr:glycosyltransferase [Planctomycetota bacterium]